MNNLKVGDKVIFNKPICFCYDVKGTIVLINRKLEYFRVEFGNKSICNIFFNHRGENIKLDIAETRNDKLNKLDI